MDGSRTPSYGMKKQLVSLEDFLKGKKPRLINSPRSLEACLRQGLDPAELIPKSLAKFQAEESLREVAQVKYPITWGESMNTVLYQELTRYNGLLDTVKPSLVNLKKAIKGLVLMNNDLENVGQSLM